MKEIAGDVERWRARGDDHVAVATVVTTRGSAPRPLGSKLAVSEQGERLMKQLGFRLINRQTERADQHPLYVALFDDIKANVKTILPPRKA